jgi:hypothetical protein
VGRDAEYIAEQIANRRREDRDEDEAQLLVA